MRKTHFYLLMLSFTLSIQFCTFLNAQQIIVRPMPFLDKIPVNSIFNLYQDKNGYIWAGTAYGLDRYDGYDIQSFINNYKNPYKMTANDIRCFTEDDDYIWVGTIKGINLINKETYNVKPFCDSSLQNKEIRDMYCDSKGNIWIAANKNIYRCDPNKGVLKEYIIYNNSNTFFEDKKGELWFLTWNGDILKYDSLNDSFIKYADLHGSNPYRMTQDGQGRYWIATWGDGIWRFDPYAKDVDRFHKQIIVNPIRHVQEKVFYDIIQDDTYGYIWALSHFRLYVFKVNKENNLEEVDINKIKNINIPIDQYKTYSRIIKDKTGNLWLGAYDQSYTISFEKTEVINHTMESIKYKLGIDANILYLNKDANGILWCDQSRYGLILFDEKSGKVTYGNNTNSLYSRFVASIEPSRKDNSVWLGGRNDFSTKIWRMKQENMNISILEEYDLNNISKTPGVISKLVEDRCGNIWIGTTSHLFFKAYNSKTIVPFSFNISQISDMDKDEKGNIWICTPNDIYQITYKNRPIILKHYSIKSKYAPKDFIQNISADNNNVWFSTSLGRLLILDTKRNKIKDMTSKCELEGNNILEIINNKERIWIVSDKYIVCHNKVKNTNTTYSVNDNNIFVSTFRNNAAFVDNEGRLYAGGHNGIINIFPTRQDVKRKYEKDVIITDIIVDNRSTLFSPIGKEVGNSNKEITLLPDARNIEIKFSTLSYNSTRKVTYAYMLEGVDDKWTYIENGRHSAFYNSINAGKYIFHVKATDQYGNWIKEEQQVRVNQLPAWYETWFAYLIYSVLCLLIVYISFYLYTRRIEKKNELKLQDKLTSFKLNYFTNISHELLTPLTIISCVADDLQEHKIGSENQVKTLRTNTERLRRLLQQILDFRKVDSGKMELNVSKNDISSFISDVVLSNFKALAEKKNIKIHTNIEQGVFGYIDIDFFDKILFNLLSNAIKYTNNDKIITVSMNVYIRESKKNLVIKVEDEGIGIAENDQKLVFNKFYNNKNGLHCESHGIGLSLTKELVRLHHGSISLLSKLGKGSIFTIIVPIEKNEYKEQELVNNTEEIEETIEKISYKSENKPSVLFIDDNSELRNLIQHIFTRKYNILTAENGIEGLEIINKNNVDIIISDIVMPKMDGLEFCRQIKNNLKTSHIPIIMLTAKNISDDQVECYNAGADSYVSKPFKMEILQARIDNLLHASELRLKNFRSRMEMNISNLDYQNPDEQFLKEAMASVERNINDPDFDIVQMATDMNMSRSTLSRKFKLITGCTPLEFIRNIKLKYACTLLKENKINISDVAYSTGFSSPKYFTKCFKEEFGMTPSEYQEQSREEPLDTAERDN